MSKDLRERIVKRYEVIENARVVAEQFAVSERSVYRYVRLARAGKDLAPDQPPGRPNLLAREGLAAVVRQRVKEDPEASLQVYVEQVQDQTGFVLSTSSMCRALQQLGLTRKKRPGNPKSATRQPD